MARWVAELVVESRAGAIQRAIGARGPGPEPWVVPIPLHWKRSGSRRGYNQAEALALGLAGSLGLPMRTTLRRSIATPPLARIGRTERARIMKNAFVVPRRHRTALAGRTILLVDDILTSGATAGAASRALKQAGAARVVVVVVARAEGKP